MARVRNGVRGARCCNESKRISNYCKTTERIVADVEESHWAGALEGGERQSDFANRLGKIGPPNLGLISYYSLQSLHYNSLITLAITAKYSTPTTLPLPFVCRLLEPALQPRSTNGLITALQITRQLSQSTRIILCMLLSLSPSLQLPLTPAKNSYATRPSLNLNLSLKPQPLAANRLKNVHQDKSLRSSVRGNRGLV